MDPKFSVITVGMPTKNSALYLRDVLRRIENVEYPKEIMKLVFVDDYSTDRTFEILMEWKSRMEKRYHDVVLIQERTNIPQARNFCIKHMDGKYLLFWDSDVIPPKGLLRRMVESLELNDDIGMIGSDYLYENGGALAKLKGAPMTSKGVHAVYMGFTLIRRELFDRVGGFNELLDVGEDTEFGIKVIEKTKYKIRWAPEHVFHLKRVREKELMHSPVRWLSYNFHVRGRQYVKSFYKLPLLLRLRIFYYAFLPPALASLLLLTVYGLFWMPLVFIAYLLPGLFLAVCNSNVRRGIISFFTFNIPTGIALSYGALMHVFKKLLNCS